jgi:hypothetical protein
MLQKATPEYGMETPAIDIQRSLKLNHVQETLPREGHNINSVHYSENL